MATRESEREVFSMESFLKREKHRLTTVKHQAWKRIAKPITARRRAKRKFSRGESIVDLRDPYLLSCWRA